MWVFWGGTLRMSGTSLGWENIPWGGRGTLLDLGTYCVCGLSQDHMASDEPFLPSYPIEISNLPKPVCVCSRGWDWQHCGGTPALPM